MGSILIFHGIYDIIFDTAYHLNGYTHPETREYCPISNKLRTYLAVKGLKFNAMYGYTELFFTLARDPEKHIEAIAVCHPHYDDINFKTGEDIAIGRIKRMRGDVKKIIYEIEEYSVEVRIKDKWENGVKFEQYKTITRKRVKRDENGEPIIKKTIYHKPYDLYARWHYKDEDGEICAGDLKYPYIYRMVKEDQDPVKMRTVYD